VYGIDTSPPNDHEATFADAQARADRIAAAGEEAFVRVVGQHGDVRARRDVVVREAAPVHERNRCEAYVGISREGEPCAVMP
jgi:hypothetical protein